MGLDIRAGMHAGEVDLQRRDVAGIGVHIASRVIGEAEPSQIVVSRTVRDLVAGSEIPPAQRTRGGLAALRRLGRLRMHTHPPGRGTSSRLLATGGPPR
jgi:class 3 adenylate cyclase